MGAIFSNTAINNQIFPKRKHKNGNFIQSTQLQEPQNKQQPYSTILEKHKDIIRLAISGSVGFRSQEHKSNFDDKQQQMINSLNSKNKQKKQEINSESMDLRDYQSILRILRNHHLFKELIQDLDHQTGFITKLLYTIKKKKYAFRDYIYKQFDSASNFYIIADGKVYVQLNSVRLKQLGKDQCFGLQSIIYGSQQGQSIKVKSSTSILYEIDKQQIIKVQQKIARKNKLEIRELLSEKVIFFNFLNNKQRQKLLDKTIKSTYLKGQIVFQKDYDANAFFVIKKGSILIQIPGKKDLILAEGNSFGQSVFFEYNAQRKGIAISHEQNTVLYAIGSNPIVQSLGNKFDCAVFHNLQKWSLYRDPIINQLLLQFNFNMEKLTYKFNVKKGQKYEILGRKNQPANKLFINLKCSINFSKDNNVFYTRTIKKILNIYLEEKQRLLKTNQFQYSKSLIVNFLKQVLETAEDQQLFYQDDIIITEKGAYAYTSVQEVILFIIESYEQPEKQNNNKVKINLSVKNIQKYITLSTKKSKSTILAVQKNFGLQYVIKVYQKKKQLNKSLHSHKTIFTIASDTKFDQQQQPLSQLNLFYNQKQIIQNLNHPNICGFFKAQEDNDNIYFLFQYIKGVTLEQMRMQLGIIPEIIVQFYVSKLSMILDYLHENQVLYRSLNFNNVIIDNKGYPNLLKFKNSKQLKESQNFRTYTLSGTPHFVCPQMIENKQYSFNADYWQLGIIVYQLIYARYPFGNNQTDPYKIYNDILQNGPKLKKENSITLIKGLLQKNPQKRIKNFGQLTKCKYFQKFHWQQVQQDQMLPPYVSKHITNRFDNIEIFVRNERFQF